MKQVRKILFEIIGLSSPKGRLLFFMLASIAIFSLPAKSSITLSVWKNLGIQAPSIGLTRAYRYLLHGDVQNAWLQNKLIFIVLFVGGIILVRDVIALVRKNKNNI